MHLFRVFIQSSHNCILMPISARARQLGSSSCVHRQLHRAGLECHTQTHTPAFSLSLSINHMKWFPHFRSACPAPPHLHIGMRMRLQIRTTQNLLKYDSEQPTAESLRTTHIWQVQRKRRTHTHTRSRRIVAALRSLLCAKNGPLAQLCVRACVLPR